MNETLDKALQAMTELMSCVRRTLFADLMAGKTSSALKSAYLVRFGITARQFNACAVEVEGKIQSLKELQKLQIVQAKESIAQITKQLALQPKKNVHLRKRRRIRFEQKLQHLESDKARGIVRCCFGSKKLFRAQFHLEESGYASFDEWKVDWKAARDSEFFLLGSKDETTGNQTCQATEENGKITLRIRLPDALRDEFGNFLVINDLSFAYGQAAILTSLYDCEQRRRLKGQKSDSYKDHGSALCYRFKRDKKGWRVFASTSLKEPTWVTRSENGVLGLDINIDHLALMETDRSGNPIFQHTIPLDLYGKNQQQTLALIGDACAQAIEMACKVGKDLVIEKLDFSMKRANLAELVCAKQARTLSSFAYGKIIGALKSRAWRYGVRCHEVNPAFTSLIGRVNYAKRYGLTIHHAAALCIGRRFCRFSEQPSRRLDSIPDGKGGHVTFPVPVRNRGKHVWSLWRKMNQNLRVVLAAQFRAAKCRSTDPRKLVCVT